LPTKTAQIECTVQPPSSEVFGIATKFNRSEIFECAKHCIRLSPRSEIFGIYYKTTQTDCISSKNLGVYQQKQLKLDLFCSAAQRKCFTKTT
jgi:hypothetical protein